MLDAIATLVICLVLIPGGALVLLIRCGVDARIRARRDSELHWPPIRTPHRRGVDYWNRRLRRTGR